MSYLQTIRNKVEGVRKKFGDFMTWGTGGVAEGQYPKRGDDRVGGWVNSLFDDAVKWRQQYFNATKDARFGYSDTIVWGRKLSAIESGNHWAAWGSRRLDPEKDAWMAELVDDETSDQMRVRSAHLNGSWHDIYVLPNVQNIDDILKQERKKSGWGDFVLSYTKNAQKYGYAWARSFLDRSEYSEGIANERVCRYGGVFLSPKARGKKKNQGCWYIIEARMETGQWVRENFPKFKLNEVGNGPDVQQKINLDTPDDTYNHTKEYAILDLFCDDPTIEKAHFDLEEFERKVAEILQGNEVKVDEWADNHVEYVRAYEKYMDDLIGLGERLTAEGAFTPEDEMKLEANVEAIQAQIMMHIEAGTKSEYPAGKHEKYPHGRHIITIDNTVAYDEPCEYEFDWRCLFHELKNEDVPDRVDGRGDVEIMLNAQKILDENKSRFADAALLASIPKKQRNIADKEIIEKQGGENNDPREPDYYVQTPPTYQKAPPPSEILELIRMEKESAKQKLGVTSIARGDAPTANASGDLAEILASQNETVITGELAINLNTVLSDIIETKLMIMRKFYTEPRRVLVNGREEYFVIANRLASSVVETDTGEQIEQEIERFEVTVTPGSNSPQKWERELGLISSLQKNLQYPDGMPAIPIEAVLDKVAERYPYLGRNGKYATINQAARIGLQVMAQQQAEQEAVDKVVRGQKMEQVKAKVKKRIPEIADAIPGNIPLNGGQ